MSGIVLSASVRQNLLSLQSTADLARDHAEPPCHRQEGQHGSRQSDQLSSPPPRSIAAPATSTIFSTASATACRSCRPPTPASPRCRSWSTPPSRSPTRRCRPRSATRPSRRSLRRDRRRNGRQSRRRSGPRPAPRSSVLRLRSALRIPAPTLTAGTRLTTAGPVGNATASSLLSTLALTTRGRCCRHADRQRQDDHLRSRREWPRRFGQRLYDGCRYHAQPIWLRRSTPCRATRPRPTPRRQRAASSP